MAKLAKIGVSVALIAIIVKSVEFGKIGELYTDLQYDCLAVAFGLVVALHWTNCVRWKLCLLEKSRSVPLMDLLLAYWKSKFFSLFMPTEYGGDIYRVKVLWNRLGDNQLAVASVLWSRASGMIAMVLLLGAVAPFFHGRHDLFPQGGVIAIVSVTLLLFISLLLINRIAPEVKDRLKSPIFRRLFGRIEVFTRQLKVMALHRSYAGPIFMLAIGSQIMMVWVNYLYALSLGHEIHLIDMFYFIPLLSIVSLLPVTIGGLGLKEGAFIVFFHAIGIPKESALAIALLNRFMSLLIAISGGLLFIIGEWRRA